MVRALSLILLTFSITLLLTCGETPVNPFDKPEDSKITFTLTASDGLTGDTSVVDTVGDTTLVHIIQTNRDYIDSIKIMVYKTDGTQVDSSMFKNLIDDTVKVKLTFSTPDTYTVIGTAYIGNINGTQSDTAKIIVVPHAIPNRNPQITINQNGNPLTSNKVIAEYNQTCTLTVTINDPDVGQQHTIKVEHGDSSWSITNVQHEFIWTATASDSGSDNIFTFVVTDNGRPAGTATKTIQIVVVPLMVLPNTPAGFQVTARNAGPGTTQYVSLSWIESEGATSYNVYRSQYTDSGYTALKSTSTTSFVDTCTSANTWYYKVSAANGKGESAKSVSKASTDVPLTHEALQISRQPNKVTSVVKGSGFSVSIAVSGGYPPIKYAWYKNNDTISGAHDSAISVVNAALSDSGVYYCKVSDNNTSLTSAACTVSVLSTDIAPQITDSLRNITVNEGDSIGVSVNATGTNLKYQWYKNGDSIPNEISSSLIRYSAEVQDSGTYFVKVNNTLGSVTSNSFHISVLPDSYTVTLSIVSQGTVSPAGANNKVNIARGGNQLFTFTPGSGYRIKQISVDGTANDTAKIKAHYQFTNVQNIHTLEVVFESVPKCTLTLNATNGSIIASPSKTFYYEGDTVLLSASPDGGYKFSGWSGDTTGTTTPVRITMTKNKSVTASFAVDTDAKTWDLQPGASLNAKIKEASGSTYSSVVIRPAAGKYDQGTIEVIGKVEIPIIRRN